jgi:hypothetical protein
MPSIIYKSLSSLSPIELIYQYQRNENLQTTKTTFDNGFSTYNLKGCENYQDISINRDSLFILTSAVNLSSIFTVTDNISLGTLPGTVYLQPRNSTIYFIEFKNDFNTFKLSLDSGSIFYISPVKDSNEVELFVDNKYVQVDEQYPYVVRLSNKTLDPSSINRQRFEVVYSDNLISFKTLTNSGYRYLALSNDNILRAVGLILGNTILNDYIFTCIPVTDLQLARGFVPANNWVTYFFDVEKKTDNKTVALNKIFAPTPTNLLIDFPIEKAAADKIVNINIANLKTSLTPAGGPAPVNNAYDKQVITSN